MRRVAVLFCLALGVMSCGDERSPGPSSCCKMCDPEVSKPCGDSCISLEKNCQVGAGCACLTEEDE